ncbi:type II toxin-antitoxin system VapC family toxin [Spinactinospora alkalitolerans]|uniref:type II toxin-antitoxin system VapC family toxin n=1 Tax=Spinactinospora alkalitolerans TaxID=687207 RepID=UPI0015CAC080|nr:type II toxin-antitoxin system VapC family toxin [Spinactinospora alkalitolerans]
MRLLLDTHILLWWLEESPKLSASLRALLISEDEIFVSSATAWEMSIKSAQGKLSVPDDLTAALRYYGFQELPISVAHGLRAGALPRHHGDPFDRILVAQAQEEGLTLVTQDGAVQKYDVATLSG